MLRPDHRQLPGLLMLGMLFVLDAIMIAIHGLLHVELKVAGDMWDVGTDGGYPEFLQYAKFAWIAVLLFAAAVTLRAPAMLLWLPLFTYLAIDDALEIHENAGGQLATALDLPAIGVRQQDMGELSIGGIVITAGLILFAIGVWMSRPAVRRIFVDVLLLVGVLAFFAIVIDMVHVLVPGRTFIDAVVALVEDGGEMVAISSILAYLFHVTLGNEAPRILQRVRNAIPGVRRIGRETPAIAERPRAGVPAGTPSP
ncbi:MAG: hypothetical protein Q4F67_06145 [Propionibacteriaceae bacterium]|nr:hypothetical protein [Propionibacteriaceae bacterium]